MWEIVSGSCENIAPTIESAQEVKIRDSAAKDFLAEETLVKNRSPVMGRAGALKIKRRYRLVVQKIGSLRQREALNI